MLYDECKTKAISRNQITSSQGKSFDWIVIDEIQKNPRLLDTVHRIIESREFTSPNFALTGSSARKLRHGGANLLAGRAFVRNLHPLTHRELGSEFNLENALSFGTLPKVFKCTSQAEKEDFLTS